MSEGSSLKNAQILSHFTPSARALLRRYDAQDGPDVAHGTHPYSPSPPLGRLPNEKVCLATLTYLIETHTGSAGTDVSATTADLLLAVMADRAALTRRLTEMACAEQWWRLTNRTRTRPATLNHGPSERAVKPLDACSAGSSTPCSLSLHQSALSVTPRHSQRIESAMPVERGWLVEGDERDCAVRDAVKDFLDDLVRSLSCSQLHLGKVASVSPTASTNTCTQSDSEEEEKDEAACVLCDTVPDFPTARTLLERSRDENSARAVHSHGAAFASTGCHAIDRVLAPSSSDAGLGGFRYGWVTEVSGEAGSGKTQLVLQCLLQQIATDIIAEAEVRQQLLNWSAAAARGTCHSFAPSLPSRAYLYVVAEDVPAARLGALARGTVARAAASLRAACTEEGLHGHDVGSRWLQQRLTPEGLLSRLQVKLIRDLTDLSTLLAPDGVLERVASAHGPRGCLLALDSIAAAAANSEGHSAEPRLQGSPRWSAGASVASVGLALKAFAVRHDVCVVVVNQIRSVPVHAHIAAAPLKRRRAAREALDTWLVDGSSSSADGEATRVDGSPPAMPARCVRIQRGEMLPALGATWSNAALHMRLVLSKRASARRACTVYGGPDLPPATCAFRVGNDGIEDDA